MAIKVTRANRDSYIAALIQAAEEIKIRADEIVGDIDGQRSIYISFSLRPFEVTEISVYKTFISGWKQNQQETEGKRKEDVSSTNCTTTALFQEELVVGKQEESEGKEG
jgi:hypothetical protein